MDVCAVGCVLAICLVLLDISYAERRVEVTDDVCNRTYILNQNDHIILSFMPDNPFDDRHTFTRCVFTIIHRSETRQICITNHGAGAAFFATYETCSRVLKYFIGYLPFHLQNGYSCKDFRMSPKCTKRSKVYAVIENVRVFAMHPVSVEVYAQERMVTTTTRRTTTTYWYTNDDDDYDKYDTDSGIGNLIKGIIGAAVAVILFYVCIGYCRSKFSGDTGVTSANQPSPNIPTYIPDTGSPGMPTHSDEAPPYSEVMLNQHLYSYEEDKHGQIHEPVDQTTRPTAATAPALPESQPLCPDQPVISHTSGEHAGNQITPTAPPPDYSDLPPPPPYPGYL